MAKADVLQLVDTLSAGLATPALCSGYFDEVVDVIAATTEMLIRSDLLPVTSLTANFLLPDDAVRMLACFFGGRHLSPTNARSLEGVNPGWRDVQGRPSSVIEETETDRGFRIFPKPQAPSGDFDFPNGTPLGDDYPADAVHVLIADRRDDVPKELELPVACLILEREFARESNHSNSALAKLYGDLGRMLLQWMS